MKKGLLIASGIPKQARIVIVGGGVIGTSVAWHLADLGCSDVVLLERGQMGCGTTWHSAGNIIRMSDDPNVAGIFTYGAQLMAQLHERHNIGWRQCGRVMLASSEARLAEFETIHKTLDSCGVNVELISTEQVKDKIPIMHTSDILGALWSPGDGRVNPTDLVNAYAREAKSKGVQIFENVNVSHALTAKGKVSGVSSDHGDIQCEIVINCAGLWAREFGLRNEVQIPLYSVEHFYILTETVEGIYSQMPTFRDPDNLIYGREETGGLLLGCFDRNAIPVGPGELPEPFYFSLLDENWDQFMPYMENGIHRIPALQHAGIKTLLNGPESFTPDAVPHLDEAPNLENYFVLAGLSSSGVTRSAGMGNALARLIIEKDPGIDISTFSLSRYKAQDNEELALRQRIRDVPSGHFCLEK